VNFAQQLRESSDFAEVQALYRAAGLNLNALNASAAALGPQFNIFGTSAANVVPTAPAFQAFAPGPYQRPFDLLPFQF
jgi:hypothetical protein